MRFVPIFAWTLATVAANPVPQAEHEKRQAACNANNIAFRVLANLGARGSSFCNDLLNIPTETTSTELPVRTITVTVPSSTRTLPFPFLCPTARAKREAEEAMGKRQLPGLGGFAAGQITAGCSCLNLDSRTIISTITPPADLTTITRGVKTTCLPRVG